MISAQDMGGYMEVYFSSLESKIYIRPKLGAFQKSKIFSLHSSSYRVMRGRLGEVESLVGDCRPPPPGNPRQPSIQSSINLRNGGLRKKPQNRIEFIAYSSKGQRNGGVFLPPNKHHTFNNIKKPYNLKKLNHSQYFKNKCSYYSCTEKYTVLEFVNSHYHLYGYRLVGLPSIAITNVLTTKDNLYALSLLQT